MATLSVDASQLPLNVFAASFKTASTGAAVAVVALRTKGLTAQIARVEASAGDVVANRFRWHHRLAKKHASRGNVVLVIQ